MTEYNKHDNWDAKQAKTITGNVGMALMVGGILHGTIEGGPLLISSTLVIMGGVLAYTSCKIGE